MELSSSVYGRYSTAPWKWPSSTSLSGQVSHIHIQPEIFQFKVVTKSKRLMKLVNLQQTDPDEGVSWEPVTSSEEWMSVAWTVQWRLSLGEAGMKTLCTWLGRENTWSHWEDLAHTQPGWPTFPIPCDCKLCRPGSPSHWNINFYIVTWNVFTTGIKTPFHTGRLLFLTNLYCEHRIQIGYKYTCPI